MDPPNNERISYDHFKSWNGPRTVIVPRTNRGFGFTLRHFIVYPPEPSIRDRHSAKEREYTSEEDAEELYFQRVQHGNLDPMDTIFVKNVRDGGPAYLAGLNPGDRIIAVNGEPVTGKSYGHVINLIQQSSADLSLLVVPKDEDILQLAYQNSAQTFDSGLGDSVGSSVFGPSLRVPAYTPYDQSPSMENIAYPSASPSRDRIKISSSTSSLDSRNTDGTDSSGHYGDRELPKKLTTSTSYTSGLSFYRDALKEDNMNKATFLDRKKEFEARAAQENVNPNMPKTFSFGLYYPTPTKKDSHGVSVENVPRPVVIRRSRETVLQPTDSQENIAKCRTSRTRNVPVEYRHSGTPDQKVVDRFRSQETLGYESESRPHSRSPHGSGSTVRHSFPDSGVQLSWTSPTRRSSETSSPYGAEQGTSAYETSNNRRDNYTSSRQYVPVINQSSSTPVAPSPKMSASVDSIDPRSNIYYSEQYLRSAYNSRPPEQLNQSSPSRTFIVKIGDSPTDNTSKRSSTPSISQQAGSHYGAAFALTRSPAPTEIEIRKNEPRILVSHRKQQFENARNENTPPLPTSNSNPTRLKSDMDKISTFRKYDSVGSRIATFEKQNSADSIPRSRSQTPVSQQPNNKVRRMSQERVKSPDLAQNSQHTQGNGQSNFSDSAPIRIYVSQGTSNTSGSPIVEIVPMPTGYDHADGGRMSHHAETVESGDVDYSQKPVRKASFLSAVNAPYSRYLPQTGYDHETPSPDPPANSSRAAHAIGHTPSRAAANQTPTRATANQTSTNFAASQSLRQLVNQTPTNFSTNQNAASRPSANQTPSTFMWAGHSPSLSPNAMSPSGSNSSIVSSVSTPGLDISGTVRLRSKPEMSAEDLETKLHRRTSYLMATSKDRSAVSLTMSPNSMPTDPNTPMTMSKHKSMRKLKDFFGEKTPKIVEAQEKRQDPASPIQHVIKEGSLGCKVDVLDGKRASDRSWRPVWAVLRGHALYLCKDKREAGNQTNVFSYEDQPISVKACIVDIAHGYTKKKNVFRLKAYSGSEYLFQTDDQDTMMLWITAIKANNNPDEDAQGVTSSELIIRKSQELDQAAPATKVSPPPSQKMAKKLSVLSIKQKLPHSPSLKRRKTTTDKADETGKPKTWKGKIGKSFRKQFGSSPTTNIQTVPENAGMFGVPLECCTPSPNNELVPLLVDLCIQIVEAKGLEMTGVYRIPGNKLAVTLLQEEFNKGIESMNLDHEKWSDVNVISSLMKSFFRQLPEPLITDDLYQPLIDANRIEDPERRMLKLKRLMHELPEHHFETFKHLAKHLNKIALYGDVNRMEAKNLAIVFGPTLIRKADDNISAMFTDMSDHCKIIESIVLHCDWFFGSWYMDNYVPTDDDATECTSIVSALTSSTREDLDNISINPREIVTSIVEAANRKLRGGDSDEQENISQPDPNTRYNERNIDQEIVLRTRKIDNTCRSSPNLATMQRANEMLTVSQDASSDRRMAKSQEFCDREFPDFDFIDAEKENTYLVPSSRYFSEDVLDRNDELEFSHGTQTGNYRLSRESLDGLRRIEMEVRALREREERRQRDDEKRKIDKQRIEQDILQTQHELEIEERHSVEDLLNAPDYLQWMGPDSYKRKLETSAIRDVTVSHDHGGQAGVRDSPNGGKYFVVKGNNAQAYDKSSRPPRQSSVESLAMSSKRTGSLENMTDTRTRVRGHSRPLAHVRGSRKGDADKSKRDSAEISRKSSSLVRNSSVRRGSLDSLIDLIEKRDNRMSWASTDSDEGLDLLTTLTSQFDQKLQTFSSPKVQTTVPPTIPRRIPTTSNSLTNVSSNSSDLSSDTQPQSAQRRLPPQPPLSLVNRNSGSSSDLSGKPYRDPSLHRTPPKPDAKVGLATRFERTTTHNPVYQGSVDGISNLSHGNFINLSSDVYSVTSASDRASDSHVDTRTTEPRTDTRVSSVMVVTPSPSVMSADSHENSGYMMSRFVSPPPLPTVSTATKWESHKTQSPPPSRMEYRPISKVEKTEVNVKLSQTGSKLKHVSKNPSAIANQNSALEKSRSASPPPLNRKKVETRKKRRHTVGGTNDSEHYRALEEATRRTDNRPSAWQQLQPAVSNLSNIGPNSTMLTWLRNERLRGSTPDLLSLGDATTTKRY